MRTTPIVRLARILLATGLAASCSARGDQRSGQRTHPADIVLRREVDRVEQRVPRHATLDGLLRANQISADMAASVTNAVRSVFNPQDLRADRLYRLTRSVDGFFREFQYEIDANRFLRVVRRVATPNAAPEFDVAVVPYPKEVLVDTVSTEITREHSSLVASLDAKREGVQLALLLAEIFGGEVDFNSELQRGDRIQALFERVKRNGEVVGYGAVEAAILQNGGRHLTAFRFVAPDGTVAWYDEQGHSLKRQFLKSPLPFEPRITSGFSTHRLHPVYGDVRAHMGVDYGAPAGTSVVAVAAGTVVSADWAGDAGRMVAIRHAGGYETMYLHLSSFAPGIHAGSRVSQGDAIGRVGSTGAATGPHLDYRIKKNGSYVNPVAELARMPKGEPIPAASMAGFVAERDQKLQQLTPGTPAVRR